MITYRYKNENPMTSDETLVRQNESGSLLSKLAKTGFCIIPLLRDDTRCLGGSIKKYLVFWKNIGIILLYIKVSIFRLLDTREGILDKINRSPIFFRDETKQTKLVLSHLVIVACLFLTIFPVAGFSFVSASAAAEAVTYESALVWRADGTGDYAIPEISENTTYVSNSDIVAKGDIKSITATWTFEGSVTIFVSADGGLHYAPVVNGVPLTTGFPIGTTLKWKAVVGTESKLTEVRISYTDSSGVAGGFGAPELSSFKYRKSFKLSGSSAADLFNYQTKITLGESSAVRGADVSCDGHILADFNDVRFVSADGETPLPFTLEKISGAKPGRTAEFFVKVPQVPSSSLLLYVYYGNPAAANFSDPNKTFDFYENFTTGAAALDKDKWVTHISPGGSSSLSKNGLLLDAASVMAKDFQFKGGVIEYAATPQTGFETRLIIRDSSPDVESDAGQVAYSSAYKDAEHCIAVGKIVKANVANPSAKDTS